MEQNQINPVLAERFALALANKTGKPPRKIKSETDVKHLAAEIVKKTH
jgi:hypothetical protein